MIQIAIDVLDQLKKAQSLRLSSTNSTQFVQHIAAVNMTLPSRRCRTDQPMLIAGDCKDKFTLMLHSANSRTQRNRCLLKP